MSAHRNLILAALPEAERRHIESHLKPESYRRNQTLFSPARRITRVVFPEECIVSLIIELPDGRASEGATIGYEGAAGLGGTLAKDYSFTVQRVHLAGTGHSIDAIALPELRGSCPAFAAALDSFRDAFVAQLLQSIACQTMHQAEERLARWLLETLDRSSSAEIPYTHDMLALMVGATRPTVTLTLKTFEAARIVETARGRLRISDRAALEDMTCPCYELVREVYRRVGLLPNGHSRGLA